MSLINPVNLIISLENKILRKKKKEENLLFQSATTTFSFISVFCYLEDYAGMPYWSTCRGMESKA
jgi:pilus assembly protein TadC